MREVVRRNRVRNGLVYLQVTRGVAPRDHVFPAAGTRAGARRDGQADRSRRCRAGAPRPASRSSPCRKTAGSASTSSPSACCPTCWRASRPRRPARRRPGSSTRTARSRKARPPMPGSSPTDGVLVTRPAEHGILRGITRTTVIDVAAEARPRSRGARLHRRRGQGGARGLHHGGHHAWSCRWWRSTAQPVANGHPGSVALSLREAFFDVAEKTQA